MPLQYRLQNPKIRLHLPIELPAGIRRHRKLLRHIRINHRCPLRRSGLDLLVRQNPLRITKQRHLSIDMRTRSHNDPQPFLFTQRQECFQILLRILFPEIIYTLLRLVYTPWNISLDQIESHLFTLFQDSAPMLSLYPPIMDRTTIKRNLPVVYDNSVFTKSNHITPRSFVLLSLDRA